MISAPKSKKLMVENKKAFQGIPERLYIIKIK